MTHGAGGGVGHLWVWWEGPNLEDPPGSGPGFLADSKGCPVQHHYYPFLKNWPLGGETSAAPLGLNPPGSWHHHAPNPSPVKRYSGPQSQPWPLSRLVPAPGRQGAVVTFSSRSQSTVSWLLPTKVSLVWRTRQCQW